MSHKPNEFLSELYGTDTSALTGLTKLASGHQLSAQDLHDLPTEVLEKIAAGQPVSIDDLEDSSEFMEKVAAFEHVGRALAAEVAEGFLVKEAEAASYRTPGEILIARIRGEL